LIFLKKLDESYNLKFGSISVTIEGSSPAALPLVDRLDSFICDDQPASRSDINLRFREMPIYVTPINKRFWSVGSRIFFSDPRYHLGEIGFKFINRNRVGINIIPDPGIDLDWLVERILEPWIFRLLPQDNIIAIHSASVEFDGSGILLCGWSGSGKTTIALELLARGGRLLSDDWSLIHNEEILAYLPRIKVRRRAVNPDILSRFQGDEKIDKDFYYDREYIRLGSDHISEASKSRNAPLSLVVVLTGGELGYRDSAKPAAMAYIMSSVLFSRRYTTRPVMNIMRYQGRRRMCSHFLELERLEKRLLADSLAEKALFESGFGESPTQIVSSVLDHFSSPGK